MGNADLLFIIDTLWGDQYQMIVLGDEYKDKRSVREYVLDKFYSYIRYLNRGVEEMRKQHPDAEDINYSSEITNISIRTWNAIPDKIV